MSDFTILDLASNKRTPASDGDEVPVYVRPGGMKSAVVRFASDWDGTTYIQQWVARWENVPLGSGAFTPIDVTTVEINVGDTSPPTLELVPSAAALMVDLTVPDNFTGVARCSVMAHVGPTIIKSVTVKFVVLPFDVFVDVSWMPQNLIDISWELHTDAIWSVGIAERWFMQANTQIGWGCIRAGGDLVFGILPLVGGVPLTGDDDVTALSFALRRGNSYDDDPLLNISPEVSLQTVGSNKYYELTATLTSEQIKAAFTDLNALVSADVNNPVDKTKMGVVMQFTLTHDGKTYVSRGMNLFLEQPVAPFA